MSGSDANGGPAEKPEEEAPKHIALKVKDQDNNEVFFKIKRTTPLEKLMNAYAAQQGRDPKSIRFMCDGSRILPEHTPESLEMEEGECIDVFQEQTGGKSV
jgi:hypothetical protein